MKKILSAFIAIVALIPNDSKACWEVVQQFRPFGDTYFSAHKFEIYSGGLIVDDELFYFDSTKLMWKVVKKDGKVVEISPAKNKITLVDPKTKLSSGVIALGQAALDPRSQRMSAQATFQPNSIPGSKSPPPKLTFHSTTFGLDNNAKAGLGRQAIEIDNGFGVVLSSLEVEKMTRTRSLGGQEKSTGALDLSKLKGRYVSDGCSQFKKAAEALSEEPSAESSSHPSAASH